jgi:hypothetical protein
MRSGYEQRGQLNYVAVYTTSQFRKFLEEVKSLTNIKADKVKVLNEGYGFAKIDNKHRNFIKRIQDYIDDWGFSVNLESMTEDSVLGYDEINLNFSLLDKVDKATDSDLNRVARKYIKEVKDYEIYKDSDKDIFLSLIFDSNISGADLNLMASNIVDMVIEITNVSRQ